MLFRRVVAGCVFFGCLMSAAHAQLPSLPSTPSPAQAPKVGPGMSAPPKGPGAVRPFNEEVDGRAAIKDAITKAKSGAKRVVIVWGQNGSANIGACKRVMDQLDTARLVAREFEPVWINIREGVYAEGNLSLTQVYETKITPASVHATLQVLDDTGVPVAQSSFSEFLDIHRAGEYSPVKVYDFLWEHKAVQPTAEQVIDEATKRAKANNAGVLVRFYEFGDPWAEKFEAFLTREDVRRVFASRFELAKVDIARNTGGADVMSRYSARPESYPWYLVLNVDGLPVAMSQPSGSPNIGFPTSDAEIGEFIKFVKAGSGMKTLADGDADILRSALKAMREKTVGVSPQPATTAPKP
jgi:hypothetical protein